MAVTVNGETKTRYKHAGLPIPSFDKHLRTFGEAGIVENGKDGKVDDKGITICLWVTCKVMPVTATECTSCHIAGL
jgi:hypothetical protein